MQFRIRLSEDATIAPVGQVRRAADGSAKTQGRQFWGADGRGCPEPQSNRIRPSSDPAPWGRALAKAMSSIAARTVAVILTDFAFYAAAVTHGSHRSLDQRGNNEEPADDWPSDGAQTHRPGTKPGRNAKRL